MAKTLIDYKDTPVGLASEFWSGTLTGGDANVTITPTYIKEIKHVNFTPMNATSVDGYATYVFGGTTATITSPSGSEFRVEIIGIVA